MMNLIKKYWLWILLSILIAVAIFIPFVQAFIYYIFLALLYFFAANYFVFFALVAIIVFLIFIKARKRDLAQEQFENKIWIMRHIRQLIVTMLIILGVVFWGLRAMEKSDNELFNQLIEIMEENVPGSDTSYTRNLTELVCPLVTPEKLTEMMQDDYAKKRMLRADTSNSYLGNKGDISWGIKNRSSELVITINLLSNECKAYLYRDAGL